MSRLLLALSILAALPGLAGCVTAADAHCSLVNGVWNCSGTVEAPTNQ